MKAEMYISRLQSDVVKDPYKKYSPKSIIVTPMKKPEASMLQANEAAKKALKLFKEIVYEKAYAEYKYLFNPLTEREVSCLPFWTRRKVIKELKEKEDTFIKNYRDPKVKEMWNTLVSK